MDEFIDKLETNSPERPNGRTSKHSEADRFLNLGGRLGKAWPFALKSKRLLNAEEGRGLRVSSSASGFGDDGIPESVESAGDTFRSLFSLELAEHCTERVDNGLVLTDSFTGVTVKRDLDA